MLAHRAAISDAMLQTDLGPEHQSDFDHAAKRNRKKTGAVNPNSSADVPLWSLNILAELYCSLAVDCAMKL